MRLYRRFESEKNRVLRLNFYNFVFFLDFWASNGLDFLNFGFELEFKNRKVTIQTLKNTMNYKSFKTINSIQKQNFFGSEPLDPYQDIYLFSFIRFHSLCY